MGKDTKQKDISGDTTNICHYKYDFGRNSRSMINYTWEYLLSKYEGLKRENLVYKKYFD